MTWLLKLSVFTAFFAGVPELEFMGTAHVPIAYRVFERPHPPLKGVIVVASGYTETMPKYAEIAYDLYQQGYSVIIYDQRGQGHSGRMLKDRRRAHIDDFEYFVRDLKELVDHVAKPIDGKNLFLLAHSLGGGIGARYLEEHPGDFKKAVLSSPMLKVRMPEWQQTPVEMVMGFFSLLHFDRFYVRGPQDPATFTFESNQVTHDQDRYEGLQGRAVRASPEAQIWGLTARWLHQAMTGTARARAGAAKIQTPLLVFQAGEDVFVDTDAQTEFCRAAARCRLTEFPTARHEILMETSDIRDKAFTDAFEFLAAP